MTRKSQQGFSLVELVITLAIIMIVITVAVPQFQRVTRIYKLHAAGHTVVGIVQQARLQAVKTNQPQYVQFDPASPNAAYIASVPNVPYTAGSPEVTISADVQLRTANLPSAAQLAQLYAYMGVAPGGAIAEVGTAIGFNGRGLPCIGNAGNPAVCVQNDGGQVPAFIWLMALGPNFNEWEAITVTPAGRVKSWHLTDSNAGTWE